MLYIGIMTLTANAGAALENGSIPDAVQVGTVIALVVALRFQLKKGCRNAIAAAVVVVNVVQRLVHVAHEVDDEHERFDLIFTFGRGGFEHLHLPFDGLIDASFVTELARSGLFFLVQRDIPEMPVAAGRVLLAIIVRPGGGVGHGAERGLSAEAFQCRIDGRTAQQIEHCLPCIGSKLLLGNEGDDLMAGTSPAKTLGGSGKEKHREQRTTGDRSHQRASLFTGILLSEFLDLHYGSQLSAARNINTTKPQEVYAEGALSTTAYSCPRRLPFLPHSK